MQINTLSSSEKKGSPARQRKEPNSVPTFDLKKLTLDLAADIVGAKNLFQMKKSFENRGFDHKNILDAILKYGTTDMFGYQDFKRLTGGTVFQFFYYRKRKAKYQSRYQHIRLMNDDFIEVIKPLTHKNIKPIVKILADKLCSQMPIWQEYRRQNA